ncbi:DUF1460 domain-containing protein [candidate division KSB1 bacterium]|nr:DUF1460 domain-containing protein [candidate division KSB1 bacterium]
MKTKKIGYFFLLFIFFSCGIIRPKWKSVVLTEKDIQAVDMLQLHHETLQQLKAKPIYEFSPEEVNIYLGYLQSVEPDLRQRIQHLAKKCVGQPYKIFLLGEFPYEIYDADPLFSLEESDCVVFSEHIYAMALSYDWKSFFALLQRIRYKNGEIGLATRNHYTEFDWDVNNNWLVQDITGELAGEETEFETTVVNRAKFLSRWEIGQTISVDTVTWSYIPYQKLPEIINKLQPGDFVNIVRGYETGKWVGHVGLITKSQDGTINFLHSTTPKVKEQPLIELFTTAEKYNEDRRAYNRQVDLENQKIRNYNKKLREKYQVEKHPKEKKLKRTRPYFYGFKFLRLQEDPLWELIKIDGFMAPKVKISPVFD